MDPIQGLDWGTYYWFLTQRNHKIPQIDFLLGILNNLGGVLFLAILALLVMVFLLSQGNKRGAGVFLGILGLAWIVILGVQFLVDRPLPNAGEAVSSFPSGGAFLSSLVLVMLALIVARDYSQRGRVKVYFAFALLIMGIGAGQLYFGFHFLTDVLAGWAGGTALALAWARGNSNSRRKSEFSSGIKPVQTAK